MGGAPSTYRQVVKTTSIFGGVQVFNILISVIRSKVMAVFLGPVGIGINGLFLTAVGLIGVFTNFGLETSAVKTLSGIPVDDTAQIQRSVSVLRRIVWVTGLVGAVMTVVFSAVLSQITFNDTSYTVLFLWLALAIFFKQLATGQLAVLQGLRKLRFLAAANLYGSVIGLAVSIPLYYFYRLDAIVPAIIVSVVVTVMINFLYTRKLRLRPVPLSYKTAFSEGLPMLRLGFSLSFITMLSTTSGYLLQIFVSNTGGLRQLGLFTAGLAILNSYAGMIFNAMATDYFPRLSAVVQDNDLVKEVVAQQALIAILIIGPFAALLLVLAPFLIPLLYSKDFLPVLAMVRWGVLGILVKAVSWSMGYILIAKGDSNLFMKTSFGFNATFLAINMAAYHLFGLEGLGISFLINHVIHFTMLRIITAWRYHFHFDKSFYSIFGICLALFILTFLLSYVDDPIVRYTGMGVSLALMSFYSFYELDKKIDFKAAYQSFMHRK